MHKKTPVAVKIYLSDYLPVSAGLHEAEIKRLKGIEHPHVLPPLCLVGEQYGILVRWVVYPFCPHGNLLRWLRHWRDATVERVPLLDELIRRATEVAAGMAFLESEELVHGRLRAGNVMLTAEMQCQVSDFRIRGEL